MHRFLSMALGSLFLIGFASSAWGQYPVHNVTTYGAVPNDAFDDAPAIQAAINAYAVDKNSMALMFPPGTYIVDSPLVFDNLFGFRITGASSDENTTFLGTFADRIATILVAGPNMVGQPIFDMRGCRRGTVEGLLFEGGGLASHGIRWANVNGTGSGSSIFEDLVFKDCDIGFHAGFVLNPQAPCSNCNAADMTFIKCMWRDCGIGFKSENTQQVNFSFYDPAVLATTTAFMLGGNTTTISMLATRDVQTVIEATNAGSNLGAIVVTNSKHEGTLFRTKLFNNSAPSTSALPVTWINPHCNAGQPADGTPRFSIGLGGEVRLIGGQGWLVDSGGNGPLFEINNAGASGTATFLSIGTSLPGNGTGGVNTSTVVGSIDDSVRGKYRIKDAVSRSEAFLQDASN